jgi:hypothetical protein
MKSGGPNRMQALMGLSCRNSLLLEKLIINVKGCQDISRPETGERGGEAIE